jgi:hypothetical protein
MTDSGSPTAGGADVGEVGDPGERYVENPQEPAPDVVDPVDAPESAASEAFQTLASEVRVAVLCELLRAERGDEGPRSFSDLQEAAGVDSSAGFAYHLRQLSGRFVREVGDPDAAEDGDGGYALTPAGRAAARTVAAGTFTRGLDPDQAS